MNITRKIKTGYKKLIGIIFIFPHIFSSKYFLQWLISIIPGRNALKDHVPWITFDARNWLTNYLKDFMTVFEYGSGGSTLFISRKVNTIISIEHNRYWYRLVTNELVKNKITNCRFLLREPEQGTLTKKNPSDPESYLSASSKYKKMNFKKYVQSILQFPNESFDLVVIDGRARPSCIAAASIKVRPNGYLLLDNSDYRRYSKAKKILSCWEKKDFYGVGPYNTHYWRTSVWKKPF